MAARLLIKIHLIEEANKSDNLKKARQAKLIRKFKTISRDTEFIHIYRLSEDLINILENDLTPYMRPRVRSSGLTKRLKILCTLSFLANGSYQKIIGKNVDTYISQTSASRAIHEVVDALNNKSIISKYIRFPQNHNDRQVLKSRFYEKFKIPGVLGCVDGTLISMIRPKEHEERYYCRKGYHARNVLIINDADLNILHVDVTFGGATHDSFVFSNTRVKEHLENLNDNEEIVYLLEAYTRHRRQAVDEVNYDDPLQGDEATDDDTMNDTEQSEPQPEKTPAIIETNPTQYEVEAGVDVRLECKVTPEKGTVVVWHKNNEQYFVGTINLHEDVRYSIAEGSKDLIIKNAQVDDSGVFKCETLQKVPVAINHTLLVTQKPVIINMTATTGGILGVGADLTITCYITASPVPSVLWSVTKKDQNERLTEKDAEFHVEGNVYSLKIKNVKKENAGQYYCYAINKLGSDQAETSVVVNGKPQVHVPKTIVNSDIQIEAVLQCAAHGEARPHIRWYKDGVLIEESSPKYVISTQGSYSNLTVSPSVDGDFGTFTCAAENNYGTHNRSIDLVQSPVVEDFDVDGPKMTWTVHSHQPVEEMEVQLKSTTEDGEWTTLSVPVPEGKHHKYEISYSLEDKQLQPGVYLAAIKVKNSKSWGGTEPAVVTIQDPQSLYIQTASVFRENAAHSIRPVYTALSTILMYLLVRML